MTRQATSQVMQMARPRQNQGFESCQTTGKLIEKGLQPFKNGRKQLAY